MYPVALERQFVELSSGALHTIQSTNASYTIAVVLESRIYHVINDSIGYALDMRMQEKRIVLQL